MPQLRDTVVLEYLSYGRVIIEQTSLCIIDIPAGILADSCNSFHYSDGTGRGTVVVTNQCGHDWSALGPMTAMRL